MPKNSVTARVFEPLAAADPDQYWRAVRERGEAGFAFTQRLLGDLRRIDIDQDQHRAVDLVLGGLVWPNTHEVQAAASVPYLAFAHADGVDHFEQQSIQIGNRHRQFDIAEWAPDIGRNEIQHFFRGRGQTPYHEVPSDDYDRQMRSTEQIRKIVVAARQLQVAIAQFVVDRFEFLVSRLDFLFRGFQFFVRALQFLIGRLHFLVRRL